MKVGLLHSIIRKEEKLLLAEFRKHPEVELIKIDDRQQYFDLHQNAFDLDVVAERSVNHSRALHALKIFSDHGIPTVNTPEVAEVCGSKFLTTQALIKAGVPTPRCFLAFTPESAMEAMERLGYPCVIKPTTGSWGRLISKINDREAAEAILEHKQILGSYHHSIFIFRNMSKKRARTFAALSSGTNVSPRSTVTPSTGLPIRPGAARPPTAPLRPNCRIFPPGRPGPAGAGSSPSTSSKTTTAIRSTRSTTPWNFATASM